MIHVETATQSLNRKRLFCCYGNVARSSCAQLPGGLAHNLPTAPETETAHDRGDDHIGPAGAGVEHAHGGEQQAKFPIASLREQIQTERMFASPPRKR